MGWSSIVIGRQKSEVKNKLLQRFNDSTFQRDVSRLMFIGANKNPEIISINETKLKVNFFKGNDPSKWMGDIPTSQAVLYKNLYKNIDLKVYGIEKQIEYDWIVKPGGNPADIRFEYKNVKKTHVDKDGNLVIKTNFGKIMHKKPVSYQEVNESRGREYERARRGEVKATFKKIKKNIYGFEVGEYDKNRELIIDPIVLFYSTYLGGGGGIDRGYGIAVDSNGYAYVTGQTTSTDFPILNQYQGDQGIKDAFVAKLDTTQSGNSSLLFATYLGGGNDDYGNSIAVGSSGCAYVTGETNSTDFPCLGEFQPHQAVNDTFVTRLIFCTVQYPVVLTRQVTALTGISASAGGRVIFEGDTTVIARGVCWSTSSNPNIWDNHTLEGSGLGEFTSSITGLAPDTLYYVRAYATNNDLLAYGEEKTFTTLPPSIILTSPNGGETWVIGATENVTWTSDLMPGELVKINLIKPNGVFLKTIADNIGADLGSHAVFIPGSILERDYKIKIEVKGLSVSDESDAAFTVSSPSITLTSPNGGENWQIGTTQNITWNAALLPGDLVKIVLLKTNGTPILEIANNMDPFTGTFAWDIPSGLPARDYLIKIKVKNKAISDVSDSAFTLSL